MCQRFRHNFIRNSSLIGLTPTYMEDPLQTSSTTLTFGVRPPYHGTFVSSTAHLRANFVRGGFSSVSSEQRTLLGRSSSPNRGALLTRPKTRPKTRPRTRPTQCEPFALVEGSSLSLPSNSGSPHVIHWPRKSLHGCATDRTGQILLEPLLEARSMKDVPALELDRRMRLFC